MGPVGGAGTGGGGRTISAAAFKRPVPHKLTSIDSLGMGPGGMAPLSVSMKKQLPVSPYPAQQAQQQLGQQQRTQQQGHQRELSGQYGADDEYDCNGAYMWSDSGSPVVAEYGGGQGAKGGYGEGKFATGLEGQG